MILRCFVLSFMPLHEVASRFSSIFRRTRCSTNLSAFHFGRSTGNIRNAHSDLAPISRRDQLGRGDSRHTLERRDDTLPQTLVTKHNLNAYFAKTVRHARRSALRPFSDRCVAPRWTSYSTLQLSIRPKTRRKADLKN